MLCEITFQRSRGRDSRSFTRVPSLLVFVAIFATRGTSYSCFFFQAEAGIRDVAVTGVQTCALPISRRHRNPGMGFDCRNPPSGGADAAGGRRRLGRGKAREPRHPRFHDRDRPRAHSGSLAVNGVHDMGGMHGFGKVEPESDEPVFHASWEGRVLAMNRTMGYLGVWTIDTGRFSRETLPAHVYLGSSYYKKWTLGLENLCVQFGLVGGDELVAGRALHPAKPVKRTLTA